MPLLTDDDLDGLAHESMHGGDAAAIAAQILDAVDNDGLAEPEDAAYALSIVAEIHERGGDLEQAVALARRATEQPNREGHSVGFADAYLGELLLRAGHEADGLAQLESLRPAMATEYLVGLQVAEALESDGRAETALEWLTEAVEEAIRIGTDLDAESSEASVNASVIYDLVTVRHRLREALELPHDEYDELYHELRTSLEEQEAPDAQLFWPEAEFERLQSAWPSVAEVWEPTWDEHRLGIETAMQQWWGQGATDVVLLVGSADALTAYAARAELSLGDLDDLDEAEQGYLDDLADDEQAVRQPWPPRRNDTCWCGSGAKYKKCCLIRSRT